MGHPRRCFDGEDQQAQADIILRAGQQGLQGGDGRCGFHVQCNVQRRPQGAGNHKSAEADDVQRAQLHLMERTAPGVPEAGNPSFRIHEQGKPVRLAGAAVDPGGCHAAGDNTLADGRGH
ncbi:hypothetical protein Asphe3_20300 [Pseudarthrobacter phenanthrenivorans Sphe3]|uniref:Uncharacterized protein n=1 Tax=Pseudarthrobacter phenanthrenivorans (strain DSM 18606 / JCM 16027 / LMG 23796 / Sphe3) TaxID=930171 RepID=F0M2H5_PSEPM|nr:hypothetical protein Asphe3_20300 [Pseudarthrobacter phenanthrenivorans Sphe3]